jgi:DNA-binding LacI/PurR family transcriptional regulator
MAIGACKSLKELGKSIPDDIKVIGFDDVFVSVLLNRLYQQYILKKSI